MLLGNYFDGIHKNYKKLFFSGISFNTRSLKKNNIFFAIKGNSIDGNKFISKAIEKGSKIIVTEQKLKDYPTLSSDYAILILHEIAHSLGLMHTGCGQDWCKYNFDPEDSRFDVKDTIMSYNYVPAEYISLPDIDIEALQEIWGIEKGN